MSPGGNDDPCVNHVPREEEEECDARIDVTDEERAEDLRADETAGAEWRAEDAFPAHAKHGSVVCGVHPIPLLPQRNLPSSSHPSSWQSPTEAAEPSAAQVKHGISAVSRQESPMEVQMSFPPNVHPPSQKKEEEDDEDEEGPKIDALDAKMPMEALDEDTAEASTEAEEDRDAAEEAKEAEASYAMSTTG